MTIQRHTQLLQLTIPLAVSAPREPVPWKCTVLQWTL